MRWIAVFLVMALPALASIPERSDHRGIQIVPAIGPVTIDGKLSEGEWDRSGRMHVYGSRDTRHEYSADLCAMWDKDALYFGIHWKDATPMVNNVDAKGAPYDGWQSDAVQFRFVTAGEGVGKGLKGYKAIHMDAFYSSFRDFCAAAFSYNLPMRPDAKIFGAPGMSVADKGSGFAMAFTRDDAKKEYMQEIRIPWPLLYVEVPEIAAGLEFRLTGEFYWGDPRGIKWPMFFHQDPMSRPDRTNTYKSPQNWGRAKLIAENNIPTDEPSVLDFGKGYLPPVVKAQGVLPIRVEVPATAKKFSLAIEDANGVRVRNLVGNENIEDYVVKTNGASRILEVRWDGRRSASWNYNWEDFVGYAAGEWMANELNGPRAVRTNEANMKIVEPGTYTARVIVHDGLKVIHEGAFYNPGNPPWPSADGSGGWLGDHRPPRVVSVMPPEAKTERGVVFLSSEGGECGVPFIGIDKSGEKIWSWCRNTAKVFCHATGGKDVFFGFSYAGRLYWGKVDPDTGKQRAFANGEQDLKLPDNPGARFRGMSVRGNEIAIAIGEGGLVVCNAEKGEQLKYFPGTKHIWWIRHSPDGKSLFGLAGGEAYGGAVIGKIVQVNIADGTVKDFPVPGVAEVSAFAFDTRGLLYVADANTHTVKVFKSDRNLAQVTEIGEPGGRTTGPYRKLRMNRPINLAVEERADGVKRLWCVENELPGFGFRRVSVWDVTDTGKVAFYREYVGNAEYQGSGGSMSDDDPTLGLYRGALFRVDFDTCTYEPIELIEGGECGHERGFGNGYHFYSDVSGQRREYYTAGARVLVRTGNGWKPCPVPVNDAGYAWGFGCRPTRNLEWYKGYQVFRPTGFDGDGAPVYGSPETLPGELAKHGGKPRQDVFKTRFGYVRLDIGGGPNPLRVTWGRVLVVGFDPEGRVRWTYPAFWWATHGAATAPMGRPGRIIGHLKWTGVVEEGGHTYLGLRGYKGQDFILRDDGMYLGELFRDFRETDRILPDEKCCRGLDISDTTLTEEIFSGWMARQTDGGVRLTYGHTDVRVARVVGIETVRDVSPVPVAVTAEDVEAFKAFSPIRKKKQTEYTIAKGGPFDLGSTDFGTDAIAIAEATQDTNVPRALLRYDTKNLYVVWQVPDATPWHHEAAGYATLFKTGDGVGFMHDLGTKAGTRIVLAAPDGKPVAVVHRPKGPGNAPFAYTSPVRKVDFAYVAEEPRITFDVAPRADGYAVAAAIPWSVIGAEPVAGLKFRGDLEVIFGGESTSHVQKLLRWVDPVDSIHDLPTESEIWPKHFGTLVLE